MHTAAETPTDCTMIWTRFIWRKASKWRCCIGYPSISLCKHSPSALSESHSNLTTVTGESCNRYCNRSCNRGWNPLCECHPALQAGSRHLMGSGIALRYSSAAGLDVDVCEEFGMLSMSKQKCGSVEWEECVQRLIKSACQFNIGQIASILESCAISGYVDEGLIGVLASRAVELQGSLGPHELTKIINSLGSLSEFAEQSGTVVAQNADSFFPACQLLVDFLVAEADSKDLLLDGPCEASTLATFLHGLGQLCGTGAYQISIEGRQLAGSLIGELCRQEQLASLDENQLAEVFYACARMKYKHFLAFRSICTQEDAKLHNLLSSRQHSNMQTPSQVRASRPSAEQPLSRNHGKLIAYLLWSMGSLHIRVDTTVKLLMDLLEWEVQTFTGKQVSMCLKGMYKLDYWPSKAVGLLSSRLVEKSVLVGLTTMDIRDIMEIFAQYRSQDLAVLDALWCEISHERRLPSFSKDSLLSIMDSFWKLGYKKLPVWKLLGNHVVACGDRAKFEPVDLGFMVLAFGKAGYRHDTFLAYISKHICNTDVLSRFANRDLVNICYGLSLVGFRDADMLKSLAVEVSNVHRLDNYTEEELSSFVYAFGRLRYRSKTLFDALAWEISCDARLKNFSEQSLSNILWGYGKTQYFNKGTVDSTIIEAASETRLTAYTNQGLVNIIYCMSRLNYRNPWVLVSVGKEASVAKRLETFTAQALSNIAFAFGKLDFRFVPLMLGLNKELSRKGRLKYFNELELANLMYGLGELRFSYSKAIGALELEVSKSIHLRQFTGPDLCNLAFGFSGMPRYVTSALEAFIDEVLKPERIQAFTDSELQAITIRLEDIPAVTSKVLDILAKEITRRHDANLDWDYPIFRPWKGQWFFQPPYQMESEPTDEEIGSLLSKFVKAQQEQEQNEGQGRPRWSTLAVKTSNA